MSKIKIRNHSDDELVLIVWNTEHLYNNRFKPGMLKEIQSTYLYTKEQKAELLTALAESRAERLKQREQIKSVYSEIITKLKELTQ